VSLKSLHAYLCCVVYHWCLRGEQVLLICVMFKTLNVSWNGDGTWTCTYCNVMQSNNCYIASICPV
jgi:hypothetical protein